jgi:SAM-dependent methyltransferase
VRRSAIALKKLVDILGCPKCNSSMEFKVDDILCRKCGNVYGVVDGVPVFVNEDQDAGPANVFRKNYDEYMIRPILRTLDRGCVVLDVGSGNVKLDHPNIVRIESKLGPNVDVVADAMHLPFLEGAADFIFSTALLEHLDDPFRFADECLRVCRPGGYCYAETNFLWPYHAYPDHFFNFSVSGIRRTFRQFREISSGVPAHGYPPFSLAVIIDHFLDAFKPQSNSDAELVEALKRVQRFPLRNFSLNRGFDSYGARLLAGVVFFYGIRQAKAETIIPAPILGKHHEDSELSRRFPDPYNLLADLNVWNALRHTVDLGAYYENKEIFGKHGINSGPISEPILP